MERELVTTEKAEIIRTRVLVQPRHCPPRTGTHYQRILQSGDLEYVLPYCVRSEFLAMDLETRGGDPSADIQIIGVGLAWDTGSCYIPWMEITAEEQTRLRDLLLIHPGLLAHNVPFDGGVLFRSFGHHAEWHACTLALYMLLASEGWTGQRWGLKEAMVDILRWESSNEEALDLWLIQAGYYKGNRLKDESPENLERSYLEGTTRPDKAEMWRAPTSILGHYCILDAEACYLLYTEFLRPLLVEFPALSDYMRDLQMPHILLHIEQKMHGILLDRSRLRERMHWVTGEIVHYEATIRQHPELLPHIQEMEQAMLGEIAEKEPDRYLKQKERPPEPPKFRKGDGSISRNWERWVAQGDKYLVPVQSKNWENWRERWQRAISGEDSNYRLNLQSVPQMVELFYTRLGHEVRVLSESGQPSTAIKALRHMGEPGSLLIELEYLQKEMGFLEDYLERTEHRPTIHPSYRVPGTVTGRLSSRSPNMQQIPKTKAVMELLVARPGTIWVDLDFAALEPVVATEYSQDPNMERIYGNGMPPNDLYLYVGSHIPGLREAIRAAGYDPLRPTKETVARAKKEAKRERSISKTVCLGAQYGAGWRKLKDTLELDGVLLSETEVRGIHESYWELFREVRKFGYRLQDLCEQQGGWILNGFGRPVCIPPDLRKDTLNRFVQSTGHDILMKYVGILTRELTARGIPWAPIILDFHDATTVEVPEAEADRTVETFLWALEELNRQLGGRIQLKGIPTRGYNLADVKEPEE